MRRADLQSAQTRESQTQKTRSAIDSRTRAGVVVRMPATWRANRPPRAQVTATVGGKPPSGLGQNALLDFRLEVTLDGEKLTEAEIKELLGKSDGLALVRGRWVEVDPQRLSRMIEHFSEVEREATEQGHQFCRAAAPTCATVR